MVALSSDLWSTGTSSTKTNSASRRGLQAYPRLVAFLSKLSDCVNQQPLVLGRCVSQSIYKEMSVSNAGVHLNVVETGALLASAVLFDFRIRINALLLCTIERYA